MRLTVLALLLVLAGAAIPAEAAPQQLVVHRIMFTEGWWADRFTTTDDRITVSFGAIGPTEVTGMIVHLYDGAGNLLRGTTAFYLGGNKVDAVVSGGPIRASSDEQLQGDRISPEGSIAFLCNSACNPSREFVIVVSGGGKGLTSWGYGLFLSQWQLLSNSSGLNAHAVSSRMFNGSVANVGVAAVGEGVSAVSGGSLDIATQHSFVGTFVKFSNAAPTRMTISAPNEDTPRACGSSTCGAFVPRGVAGGYRLLYDDTDIRGDEAYAAWADVAFP